MLWSLSENTGGLEHLLHKLSRSLFRLPVERCYEKLTRKIPQGLSLVLDDSGKPTRCKSCGYAQARLELPGGWVMEACSAAGFRHIPGNQKFRDWAAGLARLTDAGQQEGNYEDGPVSKSQTS